MFGAVLRHIGLARIFRKSLHALVGPGDAGISVFIGLFLLDRLL